MARLIQQFKDALSSIEPGDDKANAPEAHKLVRDVLMADAKLTEYGADPVLIGSYKRSVSIKRIKDVDVFVRLPEIPDDVTSQKILDRFFRVLLVGCGESEGMVATSTRGPGAWPNLEWSEKPLGRRAGEASVRSFKNVNRSRGRGPDNPRRCHPVLVEFPFECEAGDSPPICAPRCVIRCRAASGT